MDTLKLSPIWPLRIGFGLMYLYSSQSIFLSPESWTWAIPDWFTIIVEIFIPITTFLRLQALVEFWMALTFLAWFLKPKIVQVAALLSTLELLGILALSPLSSFPVTFRDLGLVGASFALFLLLRQKNTA